MLENAIADVTRLVAMGGIKHALAHLVVIQTETPLRTLSYLPIVSPASAFQTEPHVVSGMQDNCLFPRQLQLWRPLQLHNMFHQINAIRDRSEVLFVNFAGSALRLVSK